jgi:hypothetical protein
MDFEDVFVSYHQLVVSGGSDGLGLGIYVTGGRLLQPTGPSEATVFTGPHSGTVQVRAAGLPGLPGEAGPDWDAVEEVTLWAAAGRFAVFGLMGEPLSSAPELATAGPGLYRVQVRARGRRPDGEQSDGAPSEQFEILTWPVTEDRGHITLRVDDLPAPEWEPQPARAAQLAMIGILTGSCNDPFDPNAPGLAPERPTLADSLPRVRVARSVQVAAAGDSALAALRSALGPTDVTGTHLLPVGPLQVTLTPERSPDGTREDRGLSMRWQWDWTAARPPDPDNDDHALAVRLTIPDTETMRVQIWAGPSPSGDGTLLAVQQHDVLACDAVQVGWIWEYYLCHAQTLAHGRPTGQGDSPPWVEMLDRLAAREADERATQRHRREENERSSYGGSLVAPWLRDLPAAVGPLEQLDRHLLDALAAADPQRQRAVAVWAARQACAVSRLVELDWISQALTAVESGHPLPEAFHETATVWNRLLTDPTAPTSVVVGPGGTPNCSQQAMAFPALLATSESDPLVAAVDALYTAAITHGPAWPELFERARRQFPELAGADTG